MTERTVAIVIFDRHQVLDLAGPHEVFTGANRLLDLSDSPADRYRVEIVGPSELVTSDSGLKIAPTRQLSHWEPGSRTGSGGSVGAGLGLGLDTLIVAGGEGDRAARADDELIGWLARHGPQARRVASVCSGAFLLAEAGLVSTETVTTHWFRAARLQREFPSLDVQADSLFIRSGAGGRVWTSAGVTAGIDLTLAMVEADHGAEVAHTIARWLVMFLRRPGGQSQFAAPVWTEAPERDVIVTACQHIQTNPAADLSVATLADQASMSARHFSRVFQHETGTSPGQYVIRVRLAEARRLLESTTLTTSVVAGRCGFGTAESLRRVFLRHLGVSPSAYRSRFATTTAESAATTTTT